MLVAEKSRLSPNDWIASGLLALCKHGPQALRAEPLARFIGLTKGSFYWHFKDVPAFQSALLTGWEEALMAHTTKALRGEATDTARLRLLCQVITGNPAENAPPEVMAEDHIRAWAHGNAAARACVRRVDTHRQELLQAYLANLGIRNPEMARILFAASIGMAGMPEDQPGANSAAVGSLVDLVLALR